MKAPQLIMIILACQTFILYLITKNVSFMYAKKSAKSLSISRTTVNIFVDRWIRKNSNFDISICMFMKMIKTQTSKGIQSCYM